MTPKVRNHMATNVRPTCSDVFFEPSVFSEFPGTFEFLRCPTFHEYNLSYQCPELLGTTEISGCAFFSEYNIFLENLGTHEILRCLTFSSNIMFFYFSTFPENLECGPELAGGRELAGDRELAELLDNVECGCELAGGRELAGAYELAEFPEHLHGCNCFYVLFWVST